MWAFDLTLMGLAFVMMLLSLLQERGKLMLALLAGVMFFVVYSHHLGISAVEITDNAIVEVPITSARYVGPLCLGLSLFCFFLVAVYVVEILASVLKRR